MGGRRGLKLVVEWGDEGSGWSKEDTVSGWSLG